MEIPNTVVPSLRVKQWISGPLTDFLKIGLGYIWFDIEGKVLKNECQINKTTCKIIQRQKEKLIYIYI